MTEKDVILEQMLMYGEHAKNLLATEDEFAPVLFASTPYGTQILPFYHPEGEGDDTLKLLSKVLQAYDCDCYYLLADSWRTILGNNQEEIPVDSLNILYVNKDRNCRLITFDYTEAEVNGEMHLLFEEPKEVVDISGVTGSFAALVALLDYPETKTELEKGHLRLMFPIIDPDEIDSYKNLQIIN